MLGRTEARNKNAIDTLLHPRGRVGAIPAADTPPAEEKKDADKPDVEKPEAEKPDPDGEKPN